MVGCDGPDAAGAVRSPEVGLQWLTCNTHQALRQQFADVRPGDAEGAAVAAETLLASGDWVGELLAPLIAALHRDAAFDPPLRVHRDALRTAAVLFEGPAVSISAAVTSAEALAALPPATSVVAGGRLTVVRYHRAGGARLRCWQMERLGERFSAADAPPCRRLGDVQLADGIVRRCDGRTGATLLDGATEDVVTVTATVRYGAASLMREYELPSGALLRAATLDEAASRTTMLLTLLRLGGRADAAEVFEAATHSPAFHLRWSAMREWLALDLVSALPRLRAMAAGDPDREVRAAAQATLRLAEERLAA